MNKLAIKKETSVSLNVIDQEEYNPSLLEIPRLTLLQDISQLVKSKRGDAGTFCDNSTGENLGTTVELVLLSCQAGAVYLKTGEGMLCRSYDGIVNEQGVECRKCPFGVYHGKWEDNEAPKCAANIQFIVTPRDSLKKVPTYMIFSFMKGSYKQGKKAYTKWVTTGIGQSFIFESFSDKRLKGEFWNMRFTMGKPLDEQELDAAASLMATARKYKKNFLSNAVMENESFDSEVVEDI